MNFFVRYGYASARNLAFSVSELQKEPIKRFSGQWLVDASATFRNLLFSGTDLTVTLKNLMDRSYHIPGTYSAIEGEPFTVELMVRKKW